jgi:hypothetical protein
VSLRAKMMTLLFLVLESICNVLTFKSAGNNLDRPLKSTFVM